MRNCEGQYPVDNPMEKYRFQFLNNEIIYECPNSYFDNDTKLVYNQYNRLKLMKQLGITTNCADISLLELDCYSIIEYESSLARDKKQEKETKRLSKKK